MNPSDVYNTFQHRGPENAQSETIEAVEAEKTVLKDVDYQQSPACSEERRREKYNPIVSLGIQEAVRSLAQELDPWLHHLNLSESFEKETVVEAAVLLEEAKNNSSFHKEKLQQTMEQIQLLTSGKFNGPTE